MANRSMEEGCRQQEDDHLGKGTGAADVHATPEENRIPSSKRRVSRTSSMGGVRRVIGKRFQSISHLMNEKDEVKSAKQWSQRLQHHLHTKTVLGPSTHEKEIRKKSTIATMDGEGSNSDLFAAAEPQDKNYSSASRLENSISTDIVASGWLVPSPKRSGSRNNSVNNGSYSNLNNSKQKPLQGSGSKLHNSTKSNSDSKSLLFPPPPIHNTCRVPDPGSSSSFDSGKDLMNMSSGPLNATNSNSLLETMSASKEFKVVRQAQGSSQDNYKTHSSPGNNTPPKSRLSIFGGKGRPVLAPKLSKQLTDFRRRRQGKTPKEEPEPDDEDGTVNFSVTTEKLGTSGHTEGELLSSSEEEEEDPAKDKSYVRKFNASGKFQHVEHLLNNQLQRVELKNEIEQRREKFKDKLASLAGKEQKENTTASTAAAQNSASNFAKCLQQTLDSNRKEMAEDDISMPSLTLDHLKVKPTGKRPGRSISSSSATMRRNNIARFHESMDSAAFMADMFDDDDDAFFGTATTAKVAPTMPIIVSDNAAPQGSSETPKSSSKPPPSKPGKLMRSKTTSDIEKSTLSNATIKSAASTASSRSASQRSDKTGSIRSERSSASNRSSGSNNKGDGATVASGRSEPSGASHGSKAKRRATLAAATEVDLEQSFQIQDGEFVLNHRSGDDKKKAGKFETTFSSKADKDTTSMFHQSFAIEAMVTPRRKRQSCGASMPINTMDLPNLFEMSTSLLSTVDELPKTETDRRPKRRNSLPTGSSHGTAVAKQMMPSPAISRPRLAKSKSPAAEENKAAPKQMMPSPAISKPRLVKSKSAAPEENKSTSKRRSRRHSVQISDLDESFAQLAVSWSRTGRPPSTKSKSSASIGTSTTTSSRSRKNRSIAGSSVQVAQEEEAQILATTKMMGLAPPPADVGTPRRRASLTAITIPEHQPDKTVEKIRARRRESTRVSTRTEKVKLRMKDNSESAVSSRRVKDRKSRRNTTATEKSVSSKQDQRTRSRTPNGTRTKDERPRSRTPNGTRRKEEMKDESRKRSSGRSSKVRRATMQAEPGSATPRTPRSSRKSSLEVSHKPRLRDRSPKPNFGIISQSTARMRSLNRGMDDGSHMGRSSKGMDDGSRARRSRPRRQGSIESEDNSDMSDDSDYEPTPKPAAPPSLPALSTRRSARGEASMLSPRRTSSKPKPRRHKSDYGSKKDHDVDMPELMSPSPSTERRKTRNRRHTVHEALKDFGEASTLDQPRIAKTTSGESIAEASETLHSPEQEPPKSKRTMDKKLMAELARSPNKANRFRRRTTTTSEEVGSQKETEGAKWSSTGRSSRKSRRVKSDDGKTDAAKSPKALRRRKTEVEVTPLRSRLRRVKTLDSTIPSIDLEADMIAKKPVVDGSKGKGGEPVEQLDGNASTRFALKGISF